MRAEAPKPRKGQDRKTRPACRRLSAIQGSGIGEQEETQPLKRSKVRNESQKPLDLADK